MHFAPGMKPRPPRGSRTSRPLRGGRAFSRTGERGILHDKIVPPRGKGAAMSAESEHTGDGAVETQEESRDSGAVATDGEHLVGLYKKMVLIRTFEEATQRGFRQGKIGGYLHVYIGQEAVATGFLETFKEGDRIITAYRDHAHALLLGSDPNEVMAELYGKETGLVKGKGGSMHLFDVERGLMGGYGIVGGHIPLGVGVAYAMRYQETDHICQLYLGDGAMSQGAFHEAANLAGLWGKEGLCPCLFIIENNKYGMGTSVERTTAMTDLAAKFDAYGIEHDVLDENEIEEIKHEAKERIQEAVEFADESDEPPEEELYTDVYAGEDEYMGEE